MDKFGFDTVDNRGREISDLDLKKLGVERKLKQVKKIEELRDDAPNIVVAEAIRGVSFVQNKFKNQNLKKKNKYVMGLGVYQQLWYDIRRDLRLLKPAPAKFTNIYRPYIGQDLTNKTLLVWRTGGIGDLEFILPNLVYIKEKYPTCQIKFACGPQYQSMVENWDCVDQVLDLPFHFLHLVRSDYHILFEGVIERCEEAHTENAYRLFTRWMGLDLPDELLRPIQEAKVKKVDEAETIISSWDLKPKEFIIFQLRASSPIRTPRPTFWKTIIDKLTNKGYPIVITDSPHMADQLSDFINTLENQDKVFNFAKHSKTLDCSIALTTLTKMVVATDSSLIHIAESLDIPSFGIFGPFPGNIRLDTYKKAQWIDVKDVPCAPCFKHGGSPCPMAQQGHSICYDKFDSDEIIKKIEEIYNV